MPIRLMRDATIWSSEAEKHRLKVPLTGDMLVVGRRVALLLLAAQDQFAIYLKGNTLDTEDLLTKMDMDKPPSPVKLVRRFGCCSLMGHVNPFHTFHRALSQSFHLK